MADDEIAETVINKLAAQITEWKALVVRMTKLHKNQSTSKNKRGENEDCQRGRSTYYEETTQEGCSYCGSKEHLSSDCSFRSIMCGQKGHLTRMCVLQTAWVSTVRVASVAALCSNIKATINGRMVSMVINTAADITIVNNERWRQVGKPDCKAADDLVITAHGDDLKLRRRFSARISECGNSAAGDVQVTHDCRNILSMNILRLLELVKVQVPEASGRVVKASASEANPNGKYHTEQKVITKDHTEEKVIAQHDFSEETWREFEESQCATMNCTPSWPRLARPEIIRSRDESLSAEYSSSFNSMAEEECVAEGFRDHNTPAVTENVIVKVECEAGNARDHNAPESKVVKVRGRETNRNGCTEIFLQESKRDSDNVRVTPENTEVGKGNRMEKKAKFKPISERDHPIQCDHLSNEIDVKMVILSEYENDNQGSIETEGYNEYNRMYEIYVFGTKEKAHAIQSRTNENDTHQMELRCSLPSDKVDLKFIDSAMNQRDEFREELDEHPKVELGDWDSQSGNSDNCTSPSDSTSSSSHRRNLQSLQSSSQQGHLLEVTLEGKPQMKIIEGKPHKKTCSKETKQ